MTNEANSNEAPALRPLARRVVGIAASNRSRAVAEIEITPAGVLSISAAVTDTAGGYSGGQCLDTLKGDALRIAAEPGGRLLMTEHEIGALLTIWRAWHLNNMRPGCPHQVGPEWDTAKPITRKLYSIEYDDRRRIERGSKLAELSDSNPDAARLHFLTLYSIRPNHWQEIADDEAEGIARRFEIVTEAESIPYANAVAKHAQGLPWRWKGKHRPSFYHPKPPVMVRTETRAAGWVRHEEHPDGLLSKPCPVCGYKYGSAWRTEPLPAEVVAAVHRIAGGAVTPPDAFAALGFTLSSVRTNTRPDSFRWPADARHWLCRLERNRQVMEFPYTQGSAHTEPPKLADVLDCLRSDASLAADENEAQACGVKLSEWETLKRQAHAFRLVVGDAAEAVGL